MPFIGARERRVRLKLNCTIGAFILALILFFSCRSTSVIYFILFYSDSDTFGYFPWKCATDGAAVVFAGPAGQLANKKVRRQRFILFLLKLYSVDLASRLARLAGSVSRFRLLGRKPGCVLLLKPVWLTGSDRFERPQC